MLRLGSVSDKYEWSGVNLAMRPLCPGADIHNWHHAQPECWFKTRSRCCCRPAAFLLAAGWVTPANRSLGVSARTSTGGVACRSVNDRRTTCHARSPRSGAAEIGGTREPTHRDTVLASSPPQSTVKLSNNRIAAAARGVQRQTQGKVFERQPELASLDHDYPHTLDRRVDALDDFAIELVHKILSLVWK